MVVNFINPAGRESSADLTSLQIERLKTLEGYTVIEDPLMSDKPVLRIHRKPFVECDACGS